MTTNYLGSLGTIHIINYFLKVTFHVGRIYHAGAGTFVAPVSIYEKSSQETWLFTSSAQFKSIPDTMDTMSVEWNTGYLSRQYSILIILEDIAVDIISHDKNKALWVFYRSCSAHMVIYTCNEIEGEWDL